MKIVAIVVRLECEGCAGKRTVPGGQRQYGELVRCDACMGKGWVEGSIPLEAIVAAVRR